MDQESALIKQQMEETRSALADKLETLEQQVVYSMHGATTAVLDTVTAVKDAVHDSVEQVKGSVEETVETVKDTLDVQRQVKRHPWTMMAGSVALGYVGGVLLDRAEQDRYRLTRLSPGVADLPTAERLSFGEPTSKGNVAQAPSSPSTSSNWLGDVSAAFEKEISLVKGMAIGTMMSMVRDLFIQSVPKPLKPNLEDVMDRITVKLGGEPVHGPVLREASPGGFPVRENEVGPSPGVSHFERAEPVPEP